MLIYISPGCFANVMTQPKDICKLYIMWILYY
jgi:hypothetical protein